MLPLQIKAKDTEFHKILIPKVNPSCQGTGSEQNSYYQGGTVAKVLNAKVPRFLLPWSLAGSLGSKTGPVQGPQIRLVRGWVKFITALS